MLVKNKEGRDLISTHGNEVYRLTNQGTVNLGQTFTPEQIKAIKDFVANAEGYITWEGWKLFLRTMSA